MTRLRVDETWSRYQEEDPRVFSYVLANARNLNTLTLTCQMVKPDDALKHIVAQLEELDLSSSKITDATIDVLCRTQTRQPLFAVSHSKNAMGLLVKVGFSSKMYSYE